MTTIAAGSGGPTRHWTPARVRALGVTTDLLTAADILGIGRTNAYHMAKAGKFPVRLLRNGSRYRVHVADLLRELGFNPEAPEHRDPNS